MDSYDVRFWDTKKIADNASGGRYRVRWAVNGQEHCKSFKNKTLADGFLDNLKDAARDRRPFSPRTGLPAAETTDGEQVTWYEHARSYAEAKWAEPGPGLPPVGRRGAGHRYGRPFREGEGRARAEGAAPGAVRLGVQPRHPRHRPAPRDRPRPRLGRPRLPAAQRAGRPGHGPGRARRVRQDPDGKAGRRVDPAAQAVGVLQRPRLRRRTRPVLVENSATSAGLVFHAACWYSLISPASL
jgi:hypothetical protein